MGQSDDLRNGVQLAMDATMAHLGDQSDQLIELLNASTPAELAHAVAYLSERYARTLVQVAGGDVRGAAHAFRQSIATAGADTELHHGELPHDAEPTG